METKKLVLALIAVHNSAVEELEKLISEDGEGDEGKDKGGKGKTTRRRNDKEVEAPSEDDIVDAVRGAQKVLESADVKKILKKVGKAERASEVDEDLRQDVIDALEKAVEEAE